MEIFDDCMGVKNETEAAQAGKNPNSENDGRALGTPAVWQTHNRSATFWHRWSKHDLEMALLDHMIQDYDSQG